MHIEYKEYLRILITQSDFTSLLLNFPLSFVETCKSRALEQSVIIDCPAHIDALFASNFPFVFAKLLNAELASGFQIHPEAVAAVIMKQHLEINLEFPRPAFELSIAGGGYLNAIPAEALIKHFVQYCWEQKAEPLFYWDSFCFNTVVSSEPSGKRFKPNLPDWNILCKKSPVVLEFAQELAKARDVSERRLEEDRLMALALFVDKEIDSEPYLRGLAGRDNVVWYFKRFSKDWSFFAKKCFSALAGREEYDLLIALKMPTNTSSKEGGFWRLDRVLTAAILLVLKFRRACQAAEAKNEGQKIIHQALSAARYFYSYYHLPEVRALSSFSSAEIRTLGVLTCLLGFLADKTLSSLEIFLGNKT